MNQVKQKSDQMCKATIRLKLRQMENGKQKMKSKKYKKSKKDK